MFAAQVILISLLVFFRPALQARVSPQMQLQHRRVQSHSEALEGMTGQRMGNYVLNKLIKSLPLQSRSSSLLERANTTVNGETVPPTHFVHETYRKYELLGKGSFGAAYHATLVSDPSQHFVLKFIYTFRNDFMYLVTGTTEDRQGFGEELRGLESECDELDHIQQGAKKNPLGASRLIKCHDRCFYNPQAPSKGHCRTRQNIPQFIVMDYGGQNGNEWLSDNLADKDAIVTVLQQVAEGLHYLIKDIVPKLIHHDLKWDNIAVYQDKRGVLHTKIIDFGGSWQVFDDPGYSTEKTVCTPGYAPPEWMAGYAYYGPAHAFDMYSLGAMALKGLCEVKHRGMKSVAEYGMPLFQRSVRHPQERIDLSLLRLKSITSGPGGSRSCRVSMDVLLHPNPSKRLEPDKVEFTRVGVVDKTSVVTGVRDDDLPEPPVGMLEYVQKHLNSATLQAYPSWSNILYPKDGPTRAVCSGSGEHPAMKHVIHTTTYNSLQLVVKQFERDGEGRRKHTKKFATADQIPRMLKILVQMKVLSPFTDANDRLFVGCLLDTAVYNGGSETKGERSSTARTQMALLQWAELWREPAPDVSDVQQEAGSHFAHDLIWGSRTADSVVSQFDGYLTQIRRKAFDLFDAAAALATPSWKSGVSTFFSTGGAKRYRILYRRLYYLLSARLQAAAMMITCSVEMLRNVGPMLAKLHEEGHTAVRNIKDLTLSNQRSSFDNAFGNLFNLKSRVDRMWSVFLGVEPSLHNHTHDLYDFDKFDDTAGWKDWEAASKNFDSRPQGEGDFGRLWATQCPDHAGAAAEFASAGLYSAVKDLVFKNLEKGVDGLLGVLDYQENAKGSVKKRNFVLGSVMKRDVKAAASELMKYAKKNGYDDFIYKRDNIANMELAVMEKVYAGSDDVEFDESGVCPYASASRQPGIIYHVKQLIQAAKQVMVHPSQDFSDI